MSVIRRIFVAIAFERNVGQFSFSFITTPRAKGNDVNVKLFLENHAISHSTSNISHRSHLNIQMKFILTTLDARERINEVWWSLQLEFDNKFSV